LQKRQLTLRIKRVYFEQIRSGEKKFELRADNDYYKRRFTGQSYDTLMLHYQKEQRLYCDIVSISKVTTPANIPKDVVPTKTCWKIDVKNPRFKLRSE
jgi:ASC-1-like (ASCH) protein